jgi:hypothetical protein
MRIYLEVEIRRVMCRRCGKVKREKLAWLADSYWNLQVIAGKVGRSEVIPLYHRLYSSVAPDFEGENLEIIKAVQKVVRIIGERGMWVIDRGGDRGQLYEFFLNRSLRFLIRLKGDRHLLYRGREIIVL